MSRVRESERNSLDPSESGSLVLVREHASTGHFRFARRDVGSRTPVSLMRTEIVYSVSTRNYHLINHQPTPL